MGLWSNTKEPLVLLISGPYLYGASRAEMRRKSREVLPGDTAEELQKRRGWGHSSFDQVMQVAEMSGVQRLALTHHDPDHDDEFLERIEKLCQERFPNAVLAREGMEIAI